MTASTAHVPTANASKYLQQLCKHWSHKLDVEFDERAGTVRFADGMAKMSAAESELVVTVEAESEETVGRLKDVVARHLDRFAFREAPLSFPWS